MENLNIHFLLKKTATILSTWRILVKKNNQFVHYTHKHKDPQEGNEPVGYSDVYDITMYTT